MEDNDGDHAHHHIDDACHGKNVKGRAGVALASEDGCAEIVDHEERCAKETDVQIKGRVVDHVGRRAQQAQQGGGHQQAHHQEYGAANEREGGRCAHGAMHSLRVSAPNVVGYNSVGTYRNTQEQVDDEVDEERCGAHGGHGVAAVEAPHHKHIDGVEQLLQDAGGGIRQGKHHYLAQQRSMEHVGLYFCHSLKGIRRGRRQRVDGGPLCRRS